MASSGYYILKLRPREPLKTRQESSQEHWNLGKELEASSDSFGAYAPWLFPTCLRQRVSGFLVGALNRILQPYSSREPCSNEGAS